MCKGCGQPVHESMDRKNERRYVADLPSRCHACTTLGHRMDEYRGDNVSQPQALRFGVHLKERATSRS